MGHVLGHQAGLSTVPPPGTAVSLLDWDATCAALASSSPAWAPGRAHGEHAYTYGHLVGEVVRRVDGRPLGRFVAEELAGPLGLDIHIGVLAGDLDRVVDLVGVTPEWRASVGGEPGSLRAAAMATGIDAEVVNGTPWRIGAVPAVNGHASARGLAAFYAALLDGRLPSGMAEPAAGGPDLVLGRDVTWTFGSLQLDDVEIGMGGLGGSYAGARPALGLAWAFLTNSMGTFERVEDVERALLGCL